MSLSRLFRLHEPKLSPQDAFHQLLAKNYEIFKGQDQQNNHFDITFEIGGKKLYASKFMLCSVSTTFESMLADRWTKTNEPIIITEYSYDDFKEFLTFIYSGTCKITDDNFAALIDMAEYYNVTVLKYVCEEFLQNLKLPTIVKDFEMLEFAIKYSLDQYKNYLLGIISGDELSAFLQSDHFVKLQKSTIKEIVEFNQESENPEELFEWVYKWAEYQATEKQKPEKSLDLNSLIKQELSDILPFFKFDKMNDVFLIEFVVRKSFLFSGDELSDMLKARTKYFVKVIDDNGKIMKGELERGNSQRVAADIQQTKGDYCGGSYGNSYYWYIQHSQRTAPSNLIKNNGIEWYLVYDGNGYLAITLGEEIDENDYLLAEMFPEDGFEPSDECKIEVSVEFGR